MTPKEKAAELVDKFTQTNGNGFFAKECALIAVDELMELAKKYETKNCRLLMDNLKILYWQEVKKEIENL